MAKEVKDKAYKYCLIRHNPKLRLAIEHKLKSKGLSPTTAARRVGVFEHRFRNFLWGRHPISSQYEVLKMCHFLGIYVSINIEFSD
jgi:hypothetical protein